MTSDSNLTREYTLFIDESGQFGERELAVERHEGSPSSQICGILIPGNFEHRQRGRDLPSALLELFPLGSEDHAVDISHEERALMIGRILRCCEQRSDQHQWRLTRVVNNSGIGEGEVNVTYTRMVAELIISLYQTLSDEDPKTRPIIHLTYAQVLLGKRVNGRDYYFSRGEVTPEIRYQGEPIMIEPLEYSEAIKRKLIIDLKHGMGLSETVARQALGQVRSASARIHPALRLSDLVSNCTYKRGRALRNFSVMRNRLLSTLEPYDYELHPLKSIHLAEDLARHRALGQAIISVLENLHRKRLSKRAHTRLQETLNELIEDLAREHSDERASDLRTILDSVEDWVQRLRNYSVTEELITALSTQVLPSLTQALGEGSEELAWFTFRLTNLALANANHNGQLGLARERRIKLEELRSAVNHRWEELPSVMLAQLNIASSCANTLEFEEGFKLAEEVCGFYQDLTELLGAFRGEALVSQQIKVYKRGYALGVALMLERYVCLEKLALGESITEELKRGRAIGQEAILTFSTIEDKMRVYQQLAHLEALTGHFEEAWKFLWLGITDQDEETTDYLKLLEMKDIDQLHDEVYSWRYGCIRALDALPERSARFPLFHLIRLCSLELHHANSQRREELKGFIRKLIGVVKLKGQSIFEGRVDDYPAHAILRSWSTLNVRFGDGATGIGALRTLCRLLDQYGGGDALHLVTLSAIVEVATAFAEFGETERGIELLSSNKKREKGSRSDQSIRFTERLTTVRTQVKDVTRLVEWLDDLQAQIETWLKDPQNSTSRESLLKHANRYPG